MYRTMMLLLEKYGRVRRALVVEGAERGNWLLLGGEERLSFGTVPETFWREVESLPAERWQGTHVFPNGRTLYLECLEHSPRLILLGAGHVACAAARMGQLLGFEITVMDDRQDFLKRERFPRGSRLVCGKYEELSQKIPSYENAYYVIVTHGHQGDFQCLEQILPRSCAYVGMIGSRRKAAFTKERILAKGFTKEDWNRVHSPVGLAIGAQTPEEIAVSILAEIIQVKNQTGAVYLQEEIQNVLLQEEKGVLMTIVEKDGSSPRGIGSRMFVNEEGSVCGSIGGGTVEYEALRHAASVKEMETAVYDLSQEGNSPSGMICGGKVKVLFERI